MITSKTFHEIANKLCGELPIGYEVNVEFENGSASVVWYCDLGQYHSVDSPDDTIEDQIMIALKEANEHFRKSNP
jgi:hypothetical protein